MEKLCVGFMQSDLLEYESACNRMCVGISESTHLKFYSVQVGVGTLNEFPCHSHDVGSPLQVGRSLWMQMRVPPAAWNSNSCSPFSLYITSSPLTLPVHQRSRIPLPRWINLEHRNGRITFYICLLREDRVNLKLMKHYTLKLC